MKKNKQNFRKLWEIKYTNTCNRNTSRKKKPKGTKYYLKLVVETSQI